MAEPPPPPPPPPDKGKGKGVKVWVPKSNPNPQGSIPIQTSPAGYRPHGAGTSCYGVRPYGYGYHYQCVRTAQPQPQPQVDLNRFVENRGKVDVVQDQTSLFGLVRRGTGVFHPFRVPWVVYNNNRPSYNNNRGKRNKQGAEVTHYTRRSKNTSKGNDGMVKQEEGHEQTPSSEMVLGLPKEWTY